MDPAACSTLSGTLQHMAAVNPDRLIILTPGGEKLTVARLNNLVDAAASRLLSSSVQPGYRVALAFDANTAQSAVMFLAVIRCRAFAVLLHSAAYTQEELEIRLSDSKLLLSEPRSGEQTPAQATAVRLGIPHAVVSLDVPSVHVEISHFVLPSPTPPAAGPRGIAEVVNEPSDTALLLHAPGVTSAFALNQGQLASVLTTQTDVLNLLGVLSSCLANGTAEEPPPTAALTAGAVAGTVTAAESDLKSKDVLLSAAAAAMGVLAILLNKQKDAQATVEKASAPLLFFFLAMNCGFMGEFVKKMTERECIHELFKMMSIFLYLLGATSLAVVVLPRSYGYTVLVVTLTVGLGVFLFLLLNPSRIVHPSPPLTAAAVGEPRVPVSKDGRWIGKLTAGRKRQLSPNVMAEKFVLPPGSV